MKRTSALALATITIAAAFIAPACSSSSSSSSPPADSGGASDTTAGDSTTGGSDTGIPADSGTASDTGMHDGGTPSDSGSSDVFDAPYCAIVAAEVEAGVIPPTVAPCLDLCCAEVTTCSQTTGCGPVFQCMQTCVKTTDAGGAACASMCEADASSQVSMAANNLATCIKQHGCH